MADPSGKYPREDNSKLMPMDWLVQCDYLQRIANTTIDTKVYILQVLHFAVISSEFSGVINMSMTDFSFSCYTVHLIDINLTGLQIYCPSSIYPSIC